MARTGLWMAALVVFLTMAFLATAESPVPASDTSLSRHVIGSPRETAGLRAARGLESAPTLRLTRSGTREELVVQRTSLPVLERLAKPMRVYPDGGTWTLLVVDGATDKPVAGAEVLATSFGWGSTADYLDPGYFGVDHREFMRDYAVFTLTDADGKAKIPRSFRNVLAQKLGASGSFYLATCGTSARRKRVPPTLRLSPDLLQDVLVTDDQGNPVPGARVGIVKSLGSKSGSRILGCTDQDGRATIALGLRPRMILAEGGSIFVQTLGIPPVFHTPLHTNRLPEELHLRLPPAHRVILEILDPLGFPYTEAVLIDFSSRGRAVREQAEGGALHGRYVLPAVGPGSELFVRVSSWDSNLLGYLDPLFVPRGQAGTLTYQVQMSWINFVFKGRLLDPEGRPMANQRASFQCVSYSWEKDGSRKSHPRAFHLETDSEGRFFGPSGDTNYFLDGWENLSIGAIPEKGPFLGIDLPDAFAMEPGPFDLDDVRLQPYR